MSELVWLQAHRRLEMVRVLASVSAEVVCRWMRRALLPQRAIRRVWSAGTCSVQQSAPRSMANGGASRSGSVGAVCHDVDVLLSRASKHGSKHDEAHDTHRVERHPAWSSDSRSRIFQGAVGFDDLTIRTARAGTALQLCVSQLAALHSSPTHLHHPFLLAICAPNVIPAATHSMHTRSASRNGRL